MRAVVTDAEVTLADVLSLRLSIDEPLADGMELVLRHRATALERRVMLGAPGAVGARRHASRSRSRPLALGPGRWDTYLEQDGTRTRLPSVDPGFSLDHLDAYALSRRTLAYRAYRTRNGFLALKIDDALPAAEVRSVWFREGRFEVTGLLAYTGFDDDESRHEARLALRHSWSDAGAECDCNGPGGTVSRRALPVRRARRRARATRHLGTLPAGGRPGRAAPPGLPAGRRGRQAPPPALPGHADRRGADPPRYTADDELRIEVGG